MTCGGSATRSGSQAGHPRQQLRRYVALTYAGLFPDHPGGVILANTTVATGRAASHRGVRPPRRPRSGRPHRARLRRGRRGSPARVQPRLLPALQRQAGLGRGIPPVPGPDDQEPGRRRHYCSHEVSSFDPWSLLGVVRCPVLVLAGEDDPVCPLPVVEELASQLPAGTTRLVRLPGARHTIFRDRPDLAFPAVKTFVAQIRESHPAG